MSSYSPVRGVLRLEALTVFVAGLVVWEALDGSWLWFLFLFLLPDVSIAGYLLGTRFGAALYNAAHSYVIPLVLGLVGGMLDYRGVLLSSTLWMAHIGFDRMLGMGLKLPSGFRETHLGPLGPGQRADAVRASACTPAHTP